MDSVLSLCASVHEAHQLVAVEALIHAADKAKRASFITANGVNLLKEIYKHSERDSIRIRALVVSTVGPGETGLSPRVGCGCGTTAHSAAPHCCGSRRHIRLPTFIRAPTLLFLPAGALQAGICWRHGLQHEAVCRGIHHEAGQAVPQVSGARCGGCQVGRVPHSWDPCSWAVRSPHSQAQGPLSQVALQRGDRRRHAALGCRGPGLPHLRCRCQGGVCGGQGSNAGHVPAGQGAYQELWDGHPGTREMCWSRCGAHALGGMCGTSWWAAVLAAPSCCECDRCPLSPQSEDRSVLYAVASTLVNCTNSYDHEEPDPQMLELAKYAKQHIPEQHPKVSRAWLCLGGEWVGGRQPGVQVGTRCP